MCTRATLIQVHTFNCNSFFQVESTKERIDLEQLKVKEKIFFYEDVILYEDELADNGIAKLNVKMVITYIMYSVYWFEFNLRKWFVIIVLVLWESQVFSKDPLGYLGLLEKPLDWISSYFF